MRSDPGDHAYVGEAEDPRRGRLAAYDVADPTAPHEVAARHVGGAAQGVTVVGDSAYVVAFGAGIHVIDVSVPLAPRTVGAYRPPYMMGGGIDERDWNAVAVGGTYACVADGGNGLRVIDVSDPTAPRPVGLANTAGAPGAVAAAGRYAYLADGAGGLVIYRVTPALGRTVLLPVAMHGVR